MIRSAFLRRLVPALALFLPLLASARAGEVLFVYGTTHVQLRDGQAMELRKGTVLEEGDRVVTGSNGRLQIRMDDGGLVVLRPQSELVIEAFRGAGPQASPTAATQTPRSAMSLVRGGLRAITGTLGRSHPEAYEMRTPVATIGIRGTDYSVLYCADDCADLGLDPGLYVGVAEGRIVVGNAAGSLDLSQGGYGYVPDARSRPVESRRAGFALALANQAARAAAGYATQPPPNALEAVVAQGAAVVDAPSPEVPVVVSGPGGNEIDLTAGGPGGVALAWAGEDFSAVAPAGASGVATDGRGAVLGFSAPVPGGSGRVALEGGNVEDAGRDSGRAGATGLQWGRWSGGQVVTTVDGTARRRALEDESVHYIVAASTAGPELPVTGRAAFELIGNTNPTDDHGHVGLLGNASLAADFTARTVDADLKLSFAQTAQVWKASARDLAIDTTHATFGGAFDRVSVQGRAFTREGSGTVNGFFTGDAQRALTGAGIGYGLTDGTTRVAGSAAFAVSAAGD
jgi:hypothetical protein